jgi:hypothetical protein
VRRLPLVVAVGALACLAVPTVVAQSEKVSVRMAPRPGQTVHMTMTQEMDFDISFDGAALPGVTGPMKMLMRSIVALTQKTGGLKADGSVDSELTYDESRTEISMNGQPMPAAGADDQLVGKTVVMTYNRNGEVVDIKGLPPGVLTDDTLKQMMASFYGNLPTAALSVGETAISPIEMALPLPLPGAGPMAMTGETRVKLVSIDKDAQGRSARLESTLDGKMVNEIASPDGKSQATMDFKMDGTGMMVMDLDKGVLRSGLSTVTFVGKIGMPGGAAATGMPGMNMRGTMKVITTSKF